MPRNILLASLFCCALAAAGCAGSAHRSEPVAVGESDETARIAERSRAFSAAYVRGDVAAMVAMYTPDATIFPNNSEMLAGHEALLKYWTIPEGDRIVRHVATPTEIRVDGDHAYDYGVYEVDVLRQGQPRPQTQGKYVIVWERGADREWRIKLDIWNSRPRR
ncbi:MAG TPA: DUF4440 domain-containing protein [Luteimonas sp.]|nr:DUF4440 domain-containing protein [Luteimonas sp.]